MSNMMKLGAALREAREAITGSALMVCLPDEAMSDGVGLDINCGHARIVGGLVELSLDWGNSFDDRRAISDERTAELMDVLDSAIRDGLLYVRLHDDGLPERIPHNLLASGFEFRADVRRLLLKSGLRNGFAIQATGVVD